MVGMKQKDASKLIDMEFVGQLRFCYDIAQYKLTEDYEDDLMMKTI